MQKEVDDYVSKYNAGVVRTVEEYRALVNKDIEALEKARIQKMKIMQE